MKRKEDAKWIVKARIGLAKNAFNNKKELLCRRMSKEWKKKIVKNVVWPVALL